MKTALVACAAMLAVSTPALAQDENDYRVRVGLGGQIKPKFVGSDESQILPLFDFDLARGTEPYAFEAPDDSFGIRLFSKGGFSAGPAANIQSKRKNSDVGADVGKVSTTVEVGGFVQYQAGKSIRLRDSSVPTSAWTMPPLSQQAYPPTAPTAAFTPSPRPAGCRTSSILASVFSAMHDTSGWSAMRRIRRSFANMVRATNSRADWA